MQLRDLSRALIKFEDVQCLFLYKKTALVDFADIDLITTLYKMKKNMHN